MVVVKAGYITGNYLIALAEKGVYKASVPDIHEYGVALQQGPFLIKPVFVQCNHQEIIIAAKNDPLFRVCEIGDTYYIGISDDATIENVKRRYMGFIPPEVLIELHKMARKMV